MAPENTMPSFAAAWAARVAWVETDVRLTRDGVPALLHDATLDRTTTGQGDIRDLTWDEVQRVDAGTRFAAEFAETRVTRLEELLEAAAGTASAFCERRGGVLIELKAEVARPDLLVQRVLAAIEATEAASWVRLISFEPDLLERVRRAAPEGRIATGLIASEAMGLLETAARLGCAAIHLRLTALTPALIAAAHAAGLRVNTWTLNDPEAVRRAAAMGVDEITSDLPAMAVRTLGLAG